MKRLLYLFMALLTFAGCKKSSFELAFDETPEVRTQKAVTKVNTILTTAPNGWIATLPTQAGGGYGFYITFDTNQVVTMYSDLADEYSGKAKTSTFRVKPNAGAMLIFDTYNSISLLNDPNPNSFGGVSGSGHKSDAEFIYDRSTEDSIIFTGKKYRQPFKLVKATAEQAKIYKEGGYKTAIEKFKNFFLTTSYPYIEIVSGAATLKTGLAFDFSTTLTAGKRVTMTGLLADGKLSKITSKFAFKLDGADFLGTGLVYNGFTFVKALWKNDTTLALYDSSGKEYIVKSSPVPLVPLSILIGEGYKIVVVPNATTYPGWSTDFVSRRESAAKGVARWSAGSGSFKLQNITFNFNDVTKKLVVSVDIPDEKNARSLTFNYTYTKSEAGIFKFNIGALGSSEALIGPDLDPLLAQRINVDTFTLDYFKHPTTGALLAQFTSVEHPDFVFTGGLQ